MHGDDGYVVPDILLHRNRWIGHVETAFDRLSIQSDLSWSYTKTTTIANNSSHTYLLVFLLSHFYIHMCLCIRAWFLYQYVVV